MYVCMYESKSKSKNRKKKKLYGRKDHQYVGYTFKKNIPAQSHGH